jgi:hypothetical protein
LILATVSWWPSIEAIGAFASSDPLGVHHMPRNTELLLEKPERVQVLEVGNAIRPSVRTICGSARAMSKFAPAVRQTDVSGYRSGATGL